MNDWLTAPDRALVIGIDAYDAPSIPRLAGCVADATAVAALLRGRLRMSEERLRLLLSPAPPGVERPTRAAIIEGIRDFLGSAAAGSELLLYFSGHGSRNTLSPEIQLDEQGGEGEALVPCDARTGNIYDLLDRELRYLYAELAEKGLRLTLIIDSCHAGGTWRGPGESAPSEEPVARTVAKETTPRTLVSLLDGNVDAAALERRWKGDAGPVVALGAAQPTEKAWETSLPDEHGVVARRGAMTTALLATLREAGGPLNALDLWRGTRARIAPSIRKKPQQPVVKGAWERPLFRDAAPGRAGEEGQGVPLLVVSALNDDGTVEIDGGITDGVREGATTTIWPDWALAGEGTAWSVREVKMASATLAPESAATAALGQPVRVAASLPTVRFGAGAATLEKAWATTNDGSLRLVPSGESDYVVEEEGGAWLLRDRAGRERRRAESRFEPWETLRFLNRLACFDAFVGRSPSVEERLALPVGTESGGVHLGGKWLLSWNDRRPASFEEGALPTVAGWKLTLTLTNESDQTLHVMLYRVDEEKAEVEGLWPIGLANEMAPGQSLTIEPKTAGGFLTLRVEASTTPLLFPRYPCGKPGVVRRGNARGETARDLTGVGGAPTARHAAWVTTALRVGVDGGA